MEDLRTITEKVEALQNLLIACATGNEYHGQFYLELRRELLDNPLTAPRIPSFVRTCRDTDQFWGFIKVKFGSYAERRNYIWGEFAPLIEFLEFTSKSPADESVGSTLGELNSEEVSSIWLKAIQRRRDDPEGAITLARTLLESVCKIVLDELGKEYKKNAKMPQLYAAVAEALDLAPSQYEENVFKQILGGCQTIVEGLASVRNALSDAHGKGKKPVRPSPRHAELAVNLAGTMAAFIVATYRAREQSAL